MIAIFRGRRYRLISQDEATVYLEPLAGTENRPEVSRLDPDLLVDPTADDLHLAEAFERGEINAFEYADGHTYPPGQEIPWRKRPVSRSAPATRIQ